MFCHPLGSQREDSGRRRVRYRELFVHSVHGREGSADDEHGIDALCVVVVLSCMGLCSIVVPSTCGDGG